ncbi:MAG: hypothetical protein ACKVYV_15350 [Limisphaerales bacterium]
MVAAAKLRTLAARKELLAREADLRRALVAAEAQELEASLAWISRAREAWRAARPWAALAAPAAGLALGWKGPRLVKLALRGAAWWPAVKELWRGFRAGR